MDEQAAYDPRTIGGALNETRARQSELERCFRALDQQNEIISMLDGRLDPVLHRNPQEAKEPGHDRAPHLSLVADAVEKNNRKLSTILEQLAI